MHASYLYPSSPSARSQRRPSGMRLDVGMRDVRTVYLGGNITRNDWRRSLVSGLGLVGVAPARPQPSGCLWPSLPAAIMGRFDYVGPYSLSGDLTDDAEWNSENAEDGSEWVVSGLLNAPQRGPRVSRNPFGPYAAPYQGGQTQPSLSETIVPQEEVWWPLVRAARQVKRLALEALRKTDLYFAWIDTPQCAATLTEVGLAQSQGKIIWVAGPQPFDELWLAYTLADQYSFRYRTPAEAFQNMLQLSLADAV